jgi:GT2 family glycosyltransferase
MQDFDQLKNIWQFEQKPTDMPDANDILLQISKTKNVLAQNLLKAVWQLLPALIVILLIAIFIKFVNTITYVGIILVGLSIIVYGAALVWHYINLSKDYSMLKPTDYLKIIRQQYEVRKRFNHIGGYLYSLILYVGSMLYLIEVTSHVTVAWQWIGFGLTTCWFVYVTFVLSKKVIAFENQKFEEIISKLEKLTHQLS